MGEAISYVHCRQVLHTEELLGWKAAVEAATKLLQQTETNMLAVAQSFDRESNNKLLKQLLKPDNTYQEKQVRNDVISSEP